MANTAFSIAHFNRLNREFQIERDDGDGAPSAGDAFINIKKPGHPASTEQIEASLGRFYREQFSRLGRKAPGRLPGARGYFWGALLSYQPAEVIRRFLEFMPSLKLTPLELQAIERTAKARGRFELGQCFHDLFATVRSEKDFLDTGFEDDHGDPIFLEKQGASARLWLRPETMLFSPSERETLAQGLAYYLSVEIEGSIDAEKLLSIVSLTRDYYRNGLPLPPRLRFQAPKEENPSGFYHPKRDTVTLNSDWRPGNWAHEWSHFLLDMMDDREGPNETSSAPNWPRGCSTLESVSVYAGLCDRERLGVYANTRKSEEDPAETLAFVLERRKKEFLSGTLDLNLKLAYFQNLSSPLKTISGFTEAELSAEDTGIFSARAGEFHRFLGRDVPRPPRFRGGKKQTYLQALLAWYEKIQTESVPAARQVREKKISWAESILEALKPREGSHRRPDPIRILPWDLDSPSLSRTATTSNPL